VDAIILQCDNNYNEFQLCNTINNNDDFEDLQLVNNYSNTYIFLYFNLDYNNGLCEL